MDGVESPYLSGFPPVANVLRVTSSICANIKHQPLDHPVDRRRCFLFQWPLFLLFFSKGLKGAL